MTTSRRRTDTIAYLAFMLLFGLGLGRIIDVNAPTLAGMVAANTCELSNMAINPCVKLDTTQVTDARDTIG